MANAYRVKLDIDRVRANFGEDAGVGEVGVRSWLQRRGFVPVEDGWWVCGPDALHSLDAGEIIEQEVLD